MTSIVGVCSDEGEQVDHALSRQIRAASSLQALDLMGHFNQPDSCWRDNTAYVYEQSRRFLECTDENFFLQVREETTRRGALHELIFTNKEGLVGAVKVKGSRSCSDHEMVELRILRAGRRVKRKLTTLTFRKADFGLFKDLLAKVLRDKALAGRGTGPPKLVNILGSPPAGSREHHPNEYEVRQKSQEACADEQGAPGQTLIQTRSLQRVETRTGNLGETWKHCPSIQGGSEES